MERQLARIWSELLQVERVGRHDNFFELGGHSLLAVSLSSRLKQAGINTPLADLFQHPTVASLAAHQQKPETTVAGLTPVRTTGSQRPLFLIHDYTGLDLYFPILAAQVDADIPIYGLQGVPLAEPQLRTMEGIAARLLRIIRQVQPQGPYRLAGWSLGGIVAYEIAAQLIGQDQMVEFVGLFDTRTPALFRAELQNQRTMFETLPDATQGMGLEELQATGRELGLPLLARYQTATELRQFVTRVMAHLHAYEQYALQRISIPVYLFVAEECPPGDRFLGWQTVLPAEQVRLISVPGNHLTMMEAPHNALLGEALSRALAQATTCQQSHLPERHYRPHLTIQAGTGGNTPIFCIPGAGDNVIGFCELASALGSSWPVHGLQPRGADGLLIPHVTVEAAATAYLQEIDTIAPDGPVHLIGHSFGGWVALEIAHQLRANKRKVASLTVIDSQVPDTRGLPEQTSLGILTQLLQLLEQRAGIPLDIAPSVLEPLEQTQQLELLHNGLVRVGLMPQRSRPESLRGMMRTFAAALRANYRPQQLYVEPLRLLLVADTQLDEPANQQKQFDIESGWRQWAPNLTCSLGSGNHMTVLKHPHVHALAQWWLAGLSSQESAAAYGKADYRWAPPATMIGSRS
jgi:thioesterase domain-containing protein/aryl carrier-like protein